MKAHHFGGLAPLAFLACVSAAPAATLPSTNGLEDGIALLNGDAYLTALIYSESPEYITVGGAPAFGGFTAGVITLNGGGDSDEKGGASDYLAVKVDPNNSGRLVAALISEGYTSAEWASWTAFSSGLANLGSINETGAWQDVSARFGGTSGQIYAQSDVPEAATWAMMVLGFAGLAFAALRGGRAPVSAIA